MKTSKIIAAALAAGLLAYASGGAAKDQATHYAVVNEDVGIPVFPYDITDKPYVIVGHIKAGVRKATVFSKEPSQDKIYRELWERGEKVGADAVVNATYGDSHMTALSWGKTNALGIAVRFLTKEEIDAGKKGEKAPTPSEYTEQMFK